MDQVTMEIDKELLQAGLTVVVVVVRGDGKRDERLAESLNLAGDEERKRYLSIGLRPGVWM
jgi:hypothetical protein